MAKEQTRWTKPEIAILREHIEAANGIAAAHAALPRRTLFSVRAKYLLMQCRMRAGNEVESPDDLQTRAIKRDAKFQAAMAKAIKDGLENPQVNVPVSSEFRPKVFHPEPVAFGSSAINDF